MIPEKAKAVVSLVAREEMILSAPDCAKITFKILDTDVECAFFHKEGDRVAKGAVIARFSGSARSVLSGERVVLNFIGRMSGVASLTAQFVKAVSHTKTKIVCTRKTTPGLRILEKRAVRAGGGFNHRQGLDDAVLIKDNHIAVCGGARPAIEAARAAIGHMIKVECECDTLAQVEEALSAGADIIMADNMTPEEIKTAAALVGGRVPLEVSGGVSLETAPLYAEAGADLISIGALTHSAACADVAFDFESLK